MKYIITLLLTFGLLSYGSLVKADMSVFGTDKGLSTTSDNYLITSNLPSENFYVNEATITSQNLCPQGCHFLRLIVGVADAGTTVEFYDEADATCDENLITTVDSSAVASIAFGLKTVNGLCMKTVGHDTGNVTAVYK